MSERENELSGTKTEAGKQELLNDPFFICLPPFSCLNFSANSSDPVWFSKQRRTERAVQIPRAEFVENITAINPVKKMHPKVLPMRIRFGILHLIIITAILAIVFSVFFRKQPDETKWMRMACSDSASNLMIHAATVNGKLVCVVIEKYPLNSSKVSSPVQISGGSEKKGIDVSFVNSGRSQPLPVLGTLFILENGATTRMPLDFDAASLEFFLGSMPDQLDETSIKEIKNSRAGAASASQLSATNRIGPFFDDGEIDEASRQLSSNGIRHEFDRKLFWWLTVDSGSAKNAKTVCEKAVSHELVID